MKKYIVYNIYIFFKLIKSRVTSYFTTYLISDYIRLSSRKTETNGQIYRDRERQSAKETEKEKQKQGEKECKKDRKRETETG